VLSYGVAVLSVTAALVIGRLLDIYLVTAPVSLFLCAIMFSAWFGGVKPGLLAAALSLLAFKYYFANPLYSLAVEIKEVPRLIIFALSALFVGALSAAQRRATESLRDARDDLSRTVQELRRSNETLQTEMAEHERAEEALRNVQANLAHVSRVTTLGELTASIAHEVNQPLAAVVTNASASLRWLDGQSPNINEACQALARIIKEGNRASEVIARVRALARKAPSRKDWLDLNETIREVLALTLSQVQKNQIALETHFAPDLPLIPGDRIQLQQVLLNLILNAVEAMGRVSDGPRQLLVSTSKDETKSVLVAVSDSGPGLEAASFEQLFEAFYTTKADGMGMGLMISHSIIQAHNGRLWATGRDGRGMTFQFTLPTEVESV
jgi:C4-dicarboxylate-specific signal transduction histidine kinase